MGFFKRFKSKLKNAIAPSDESFQIVTESSLDRRYGGRYGKSIKNMSPKELEALSENELKYLEHRELRELHQGSQQVPIFMVAIAAIVFWYVFSQSELHDRMFGKSYQSIRERKQDNEIRSI